jgi:oxygenase
MGLIGDDRAVIVVGAGPVGLMLACELRRHGVDVIVLEQLDQPTGESRASQLNARTMEIFAERGLLITLGGVPREVMGHFGGIPIDVSGVASPFAGLWKVPQFQTEALLARTAEAAGARIRRGCRFAGVEENGDGLTVLVDGPDGRVLMRCSYLIGCDGAGSPVRAAAGIAFAGQAPQRRLLRADVDGIVVRERRFERTPYGLAVAARRPDGVTRIMLHEFGASDPGRAWQPSFADLVAAWRRVTGEDISAGRPLWVDAFDDEARQAVSYRNGRVLLAGDAAHLHMPIGGQALNLGLQDAVNLGWKLAAAVRGWAPPGLLDSYHLERHPVAAAVIQNVKAQAIIQLGNAEVLGIRTVLTEVLAQPATRDLIAAELSGLAVRYPMPMEPGDPRAAQLLGRRLPPSPIQMSCGRSSTADLLGDGRPLLLVLCPRRQEAFAAARAPWAGRVRLVTARASEDTPLDGVAAVLVRPDGVVVWSVRTEQDAATAPGAHPAADLGALSDALRRWFGEPDAADGDLGVADLLAASDGPASAVPEEPEHFSEEAEQIPMNVSSSAKRSERG